MLEPGPAFATAPRGRRSEQTTTTRHNARHDAGDEAAANSRRRNWVADAPSGPRVIVRSGGPTSVLPRDLERRR
jgi:hypothetical protein